jgi:antitoxin CcdA
MHLLTLALYAHILYALHVGVNTMKAFDSQAPKKPTNLSINSDLLTKARKMNINLSATLENELAKQVQIKQREQWLQENAIAIQAYNDFVENEGVFSEGIRSF